MKQSPYKLSLAALLVFAASFQSAIAQTGVGIGTATPATAAKLDVTSTTQGFLPPRMSQAQMTAIASPVAGLTVWCNDCSPIGLWNYNGTAWVSVGANNLPTATFTASTLNCGGTLSGTYSPGVAMTASNTKVVTIDVVTPGSYMAMTNTVNGVTFTSTSAFFAAGTSAQVTLGASGTPLAVGTFTYTVTLGGQTCTFNVAFNLAATFNCAGATQIQTPIGTLVNSTAYTGSYSIPYTVGNNGAYAATSQTSNGLTFTRTAGTYLPGGGTVVYNLSGTYTGATNGTVTFTTPECGGVTFGDAIRGALAAAGCASCAAYDAAVVNSWVAVTAAEYNAAGNTANIAGVAKTGASDAAIASPSSYNWTNAVTVGPAPPAHTPAWGLSVANRYIVAYKIIYNGAQNNVQFKTGSTVNNGFTAYGGTNSIVTGINYLVQKKPSVLNGSNPYIGIYNGNGGPGQMGLINGASPVWFSGGNVSNLTNSSNGEPAIQAISTATKQW